MNHRGQRTSFQDRLTMVEQAATGQTDSQIALAVGCSVWTVRKWRRRAQQRGRAGLTAVQGRPAAGPLGTWTPALGLALRQLRTAHPGWGPATLLAALRSDSFWATQRLPSRARVAAFLTAEGLTRRYRRHSTLPQPPLHAPHLPHEEWQLDAQGTMTVAGVGPISLITCLDVVSRLKLESYPSLGSKNPPAEDYYLVLRRAFLTYGLPQRLSFDHGTVFYDPTTPSPFPTRLHLWLLALGVEVRFTRVRCPTDHALIERTHQTMTLQALQGQTWVNQTALWAGLDARRAVLNTQLPVQALGDQPPLQAYPGAVHSGRPYRPEWEEDLLNLERVWTYLAQGRWFRQGQRAGTFYLGGYRYAVGHQGTGRTIEITCDPLQQIFVCQPEGSVPPICLPVQGITKAALMGDLAHLLDLPSYQLAFPFSAQAWRQQHYACCLTGTTL